MTKKINSSGMWRIFISCCLLFLLDIGIYAQHSQTSKGKVIDATTNEPLIGVSILEKGTGNGVVTDIDGNYSLNVSSPQAVLIFSYIGYESVEKKVSDIRGIIKLNPTQEAETSPHQSLIKKIVHRLAYGKL